MPLVRLIYASKKTDQWAESDLGPLIEGARNNNRRHMVTGCLVFNRKYFMQCLEGSRAQVNQIYNLVSQDPRHCDIELLYYDYIDQRDFGDWDMHYVPDSKLSKELIKRFSGVDDLDPYLMTRKGSIEFLKQAVATNAGTL